MNDLGEVLSVLVQSEKGEFMYNILERNDNVLAIIEEGFDADLVPDIKGNFEYKKLPGKYPVGVMVYLIDDEGNILASSMINENGDFVFIMNPILWKIEI